MIQSGIWWLFLLAGPPVYWLLPAALRTFALIAASLGLLALFAGWDLAIMLGLALAVYAAFHLPARVAAALPPALVRLIRSPWPLWAALTYFIWSKYLPAALIAFAAEGITDVLIPLGISYFSFKLMHYCIEARRGNFAAHSLPDYLVWLFAAPIFTAGPIERFDHFIAERQIVRFDRAFIREGVLRIAQGLVKKFVIGWLVLKMLEQLTDKQGLEGIALAATAADPLTVWAALLLALVYTYLDFAAYSDIAIGSARLFGLRIMENFNLPLLATNLQIFWQRWHMTLANWCRTYIFMGLIGLTRSPYVATLVTFAAIGLWHAASLHWLAWGLWHGVGLVVLSYWTQVSRRRKITFFKSGPGAVLGWALTLAFVALGDSFTALYGHAPISAAFRLMAMAFGLAG